MDGHAPATESDRAGTRRLVVPRHVDVRGDHARAASYFLFLGDTSVTPAIRPVGAYHDELIRTAEGWRLRHREVTNG